MAREFAEIKAAGALQLPQDEMERITAYFAPPAFETGLSDDHAGGGRGLRRLGEDQCAKHIGARLCHRHHHAEDAGPGAGRRHGGADGRDRRPDGRFSLGEVRVSHEQNLVLPHVRKKDLPAIYARLKELDFAAPNAGLITDIIACPGLDYCDLANARSIPIAQKIAKRFEDPERQHEIGELKIKISGCINACGHHHAGHIGILGVDKKGVEFYQLVLGGSGAEDASIGDHHGPGLRRA